MADKGSTISEFGRAAQKTFKENQKGLLMILTLGQELAEQNYIQESDAETQYHDQVKLETKHDCLYYAVLWSPAFAMLTILLYNLLFLYRFQRASNKRKLTMKYSRRCKSEMTGGDIPDYHLFDEVSTNL